MKCKKVLVLAFAGSLLLTACGGKTADNANAGSKPEAATQETAAETTPETPTQEPVSETSAAEIDAQTLQDLENRAAAAHTYCALDRFNYVGICLELKDLANGDAVDPQYSLDWITATLEEAEAQLADKEARFIASAADGVDFEDGTYMAEHGFKLYTAEQACIPNAAYVFMSPNADLSENPPDESIREMIYVDPEVIDKQPYIIDNISILNDPYAAYYDVNGSDEMHTGKIHFVIGYENEDGHMEYRYNGNGNVWYAFGIYDKYTGQLLFNDYLETTTTTVNYNGKTADITIAYEEGSKTFALRKLELYYTIEAPENYDGAVCAVLPVTEAADPSYDLADYDPDELRFFNIMRQK